jgi:hypothetical protein
MNVIDMSNISALPVEIQGIIREYVPESVLAIVCREKYLTNHKLITIKIPKRDFESYIRFIFRNDYNFVAERLLEEKFEKWNNMRGITYKEYIFPTYTSLLMYYCIEYHASRCKELLKKYINNSGGKNRHKKNRIKNIRWSN